MRAVLTSMSILTLALTLSAGAALADGNKPGTVPMAEPPPEAQPPAAEPDKPPVQDPVDKADTVENHYVDGFYFSLGVGGAIATGDQGVGIESRGGCPDAGPQGAPLFFFDVDSFNCVYVDPPAGEDFESTLKDLRRTDIASGMHLQIRIGYNILGYVSPEIVLSGNGGFDLDEGMANVGFQLRLHWAMLALPLEEREWDGDLYYGVGYTIAGYHPEPRNQGGEDEGKGWEGVFHAFGTSFSYMVGKRVSVGLDLRFVLPQYVTWIVNFDKGFRHFPDETPSTLVFAPTILFNFHL